MNYNIHFIWSNDNSSISDRTHNIINIYNDFDHFFKKYNKKIKYKIIIWINKNKKVIKKYFENINNYELKKIPKDKELYDSNMLRMWIVCNYDKGSPNQTVNAYFANNQKNIGDLLYRDILMINNEFVPSDKPDNYLDSFPFKIYNGFRLATPNRTINTDIIFANPNDPKTKRIYNEYVNNGSDMNHKKLINIIKNMYKINNGDIDVYWYHMQFYKKNVNGGYYYKCMKYKYKLDKLFNNIG